MVGFQYFDVTLSLVAGLLTGGFLGYLVALVVYRLYFSPISMFPGSKLAAATLWYEFYYEVIKRGQFQFKIQEWHKQYGPIVRINPFEIHADDPKGDFYQVLFSGTGIRDKHYYYTAQFGTPKSGFGTVSHHLHRIRRKPLNPFFQPASILRFEPVIHAKLDRFCERLNEYKCNDLGAVHMRVAYMAFATDVVTLFILNWCWNHLDSPDFNPFWWQTTQNVGDMTKWVKQFPWLLTIVNSIPPSIVKAINPDLILVLDFQSKVRSIAQGILDGTDDTEKYEDGSPCTIFHEMLKSDMPPEEKQLDNLWQEGQNFIGAGSDSVAQALTLTTYYLLANPSTAWTLREELKTVGKDADGHFALTDLQKLPYLTGVVLEGLRMSYGASCRLTRVAPNEALQFQDWSIPAGTAISMSALMMHHNENIFPNSKAFLPERWSERPDGGKALERYMVTFSKGSRQCIAMTLAKAELFLTIATIFSRYNNMELFDMDFERDVAMKYDMFVSAPSLESRGIRVLFNENKEDA